MEKFQSFSMWLNEVKELIPEIESLPYSRDREPNFVLMLWVFLYISIVVTAVFGGFK